MKNVLAFRSLNFIACDDLTLFWIVGIEGIRAGVVDCDGTTASKKFSIENVIAIIIGCNISSKACAIDIHCRPNFPHNNCTASASSVVKAGRSTVGEDTEANVNNGR